MSVVFGFQISPDPLLDRGPELAFLVEILFTAGVVLLLIAAFVASLSRGKFLDLDRKSVV
jgi:hypothetical protein